MKNVMDYEMDDILELVGLSRRRSSIAPILAAVGFVAVGAAIGAGAGLAFAPASGQRLRKDVGVRFDQLRGRWMNAEHRQKNHAASAAS